MLYRLRSENRFDLLSERLQREETIAAGLLSDVCEGACGHPLASSDARNAERIDRLIAAGAWSDAALTSGFPPDLALDLKVEAVERIGAETFIYGHHEQAGEILVRVPGESAPTIGEDITAVASRAKLHVFSGDGRRRIDL